MRGSPSTTAVPLTSADVKFTVEYLQKNPRPRWVLTNIDRVETPDALTAIFVLKEPKASFVLNPLADLPIIPQHIWSSIEKPLEQTTQLPIGSGPYKIVEYVENQVHRFQANPTYFKGRPIVTEIVMPYIANHAGRVHRGPERPGRRGLRRRSPLS